MSDRLERESERNAGGRSSTNMMRLFGQMLMLPLTAFVYSMEMLVKTMQGMQRIVDEGLELTAGSGAPPRDDGQTSEEGPASSRSLAAQSPGQPAGSPAEHTARAIAVATPETEPRSSHARDAAGVRQEEEKVDRDLRDDMLKLVRYKVLFVKREYEHAFAEREDLVAENMDGAAFTAWKVAEFIQELGREPRTAVPEKWGQYPGGEYVEEAGGAVGSGGGSSGGGRRRWLVGLPHEDKKYLRVYYEVLDRYPRERFKYEEQQVKVLEQIRDELREGNDKTPGKSR